MVAIGKAADLSSQIILFSLLADATIPGLLEYGNQSPQYSDYMDYSDYSTRNSRIVSPSRRRKPVINRQRFLERPANRNTQRQSSNMDMSLGNLRPQNTMNLGFQNYPRQNLNTNFGYENMQAQYPDGFNMQAGPYMDSANDMDDAQGWNSFRLLLAVSVFSMFSVVYFARFSKKMTTIRN